MIWIVVVAGSDLKALNVIECKAYLRKHGLRLSGTKAVFIERIVEHWRYGVLWLLPLSLVLWIFNDYFIFSWSSLILRIKDGSGEKLYPRSSFAINCKGANFFLPVSVEISSGVWWQFEEIGVGDVCKGDTVLFTQKMQKSGKIVGRRTVAGQVVKESYGTAKQQHTFTVSMMTSNVWFSWFMFYFHKLNHLVCFYLLKIEVLWCEGIHKLPPLYPLLVKGRNLYRLMTLRQVSVFFNFTHSVMSRAGFHLLMSWLLILAMG